MANKVRRNDIELAKEAVELLNKYGTIEQARKQATRIYGKGKGVHHTSFRRRLNQFEEQLGKSLKEDNVIKADIQKKIIRTPTSVDELAFQNKCKKNKIYEILGELSKEGFIIHECDGLVSLEKSMQLPDPNAADLPTYVSRPDNTFLFGALGDSHIASKYARHDVLENLFDKFEEAEVDRVFHTGNYIDGECSFNQYDLEVRGLSNQMKMLAATWPERGLVTYAVSGDDHEGWYTSKFGVDVGFYAEKTFDDVSREDWVNLGYMEAFVRLVNANTGHSTIMTVCHPGGGSAYAISYSIQKIIESLDGGEKPAVGLYGHYHKMWAGNIRNVWCIQTGCTQDQTPFMRKKKLEAHVGGFVVGLEQDPGTGAIVGCTPRMIRYFNQGYYNNRWNRSGHIAKGKRSIKG